MNEVFVSIFQIFVISSPLLLASLGALCSEYAGRMAIFAEGVINLGAFLCFAFSALFVKLAGNSPAGLFVLVPAVFAALTVCCAFIVSFSLLIEKCGVNPFLISLALNLVCNGLISFFSFLFFGTRGVLRNEFIDLNGASANLYTMLLSVVVGIAAVTLLHLTKKGLYLRVTGSDEKVLRANGIDTQKIRIASWGIAAVFCALAGCILTLRLSSFVPGVASGTGWLALAAVFLGRKKAGYVLVSVFVFSAARFFAANLQNFSVFAAGSFAALPSSFLLALPYLLALVFIFFSDSKK